MRFRFVHFSGTWPRRLVAAGMRLGAVLFVVGLAVRLTISDRFLIANTIFYATPWPILNVLGIVTLRWLSSIDARRSVRRLAAVAMLGCGLAWGVTNWSFRGADVQPGDVRVLTWNLGHGRLGLAELARGAAELDPDIAVFVEADPSRTNVRQVFRDAFPDRYVFLLGGGIVLVSRWPGGEARAYQLGVGKIETRIREIELDTPWGEWTIFGCDVASNIAYQRAPHVRELAARIARRANPVIIAGDFNTPLESVHFAMLRSLGLQEAFETAGSGYLPTWPVPCPVLSLDQIWLDPRLLPVRCERHWNWRSDHAAVIAVVRPVP